jgi:hypothetical protein
VVLVLVALAIAVWKPWTGSSLPEAPGGAASPRRAGGEHAAADPPASLALSRPTQQASVASPLLAPCLSQTQWRLLTRERFGGNTIRVWLPIQPLVASRDRDPTAGRLPLVSVISNDVELLGYCPPRGLTVGSATAAVWRLTAGAAARPIQSIERVATPVEGFGDSYRPSGSAPTDRWAPGDYVWRVMAGGSAWWFQVRISGGFSAD